MSVIGAGFQPAGLSSAGYGVPSGATSPNGATLPDATTSLPQTGRFINFQTKDYSFTSDGRIQGMGTTEQLVLLALTTVFGSSADPALGQMYTSIQEKGTNFQQQATSAVQSALSDLIKRGFITLDGVGVLEPPGNPDAGAILVAWTDLATGTQNTNSFGP
jgi:hypothetical protein